jgi:hypothetical protein
MTIIKGNQGWLSLRIDKNNYVEIDENNQCGHNCIMLMEEESFTKIEVSNICNASDIDSLSAYMHACVGIFCKFTDTTNDTRQRGSFKSKFNLA